MLVSWCVFFFDVISKDFSTEYFSSDIPSLFLSWLSNLFLFLCILDIGFGILFYFLVYPFRSVYLVTDRMASQDDNDKVSRRRRPSLLLFGCHTSSPRLLRVQLNETKVIWFRYKNYKKTVIKMAF